MKSFRNFIRTTAGKFDHYTGAERVSHDRDQAASRFVGTTSLTNIYKSMTPGYEAPDKEAPDPVETPESK